MEKINPRTPVITGCGVVTAYGPGTVAFVRGLKSGVSAIRPIPASRFQTNGLPVTIAGLVPDTFDRKTVLGRKWLRRTDPSMVFAIAAAQEALEDAGLPLPFEQPERVGIYVSSAGGGLNLLTAEFVRLFTSGLRKIPWEELAALLNQIREGKADASQILLRAIIETRVNPFLFPFMIVDAVGGFLAILLGAKGPNIATVSACSTSLNAIGEAAEVILRGDADVMIAGGAEAPVSPLGMKGFSDMGVLDPRVSKPYDLGRKGFNLGEGAGVVTIEALEHAQKRGAMILAVISGYATNVDASDMAHPTGEGMAWVLKEALRRSGLQKEDIGLIAPHAAATIGDILEAQAIHKTFGAHADPQTDGHLHVCVVKPYVGHTQGAIGAMQTIAALKAMATGIIFPHPTLKDPDPECNLAFVVGDPVEATIRAVEVGVAGLGGHNAALVLGEWPNG